jgi:hypothetical protein
LGHGTVGRNAEKGSLEAQPPGGVEGEPGNPASGTDTHQPPHFDDWELDQQLRHIERLLGAAKAPNPPGETAAGRAWARVDAPHAAVPGWHCTPARRPATPADEPAEDGNSIANPVWVVLALGLMSFVCGGVLLGWSVVTGRGDLWTRGMPFAVGGQIALLVGLVLQLERLWRAGRHTAAKLEHVDQQLHGLKTTTAMLGTTHSSAATAFYSHMAGGANPQLLLADLKGQLDMLSIKLGQSER